jgi:hypothetical protein
VIPKVSGIGQKGKTVLIYLDREPTDDEVREISAAIKDAQSKPVPTIEEKPAKKWFWKYG